MVLNSENVYYKKNKNDLEDWKIIFLLFLAITIDLEQ